MLIDTVIKLFLLLFTLLNNLQVYCTPHTPHTLHTPHTISPIILTTQFYEIFTGDIPFKVFQALGDGIIKIEESEVKR